MTGAQQADGLSSDGSDSNPSAWQPIETAPRDCYVLLAGDYEKMPWIALGHWDAEFEFSWDEDADAPTYVGAWTDNTVASWGDETCNLLTPTHWMHLPPPPTPGEAA